MSNKKGDAPGMKGCRARDNNGELRKKRIDTHAITIEEKYDVDLKSRDDKHLGTILKERGLDSFDDLLKSL
jgi:hypothetical protein